MRHPIASGSSSTRDHPASRFGVLGRPVGRGVVVLLGLGIALAPLWMFYDSLRYSRLFMDDFPYIEGSRNLDTTLTNLFRPHNAHIVPAWRILTWCLIASSGSLSALPATFAWAAIGVVPLVMAAIGRLVARDTQRPLVGLIAMAAAGTTSILKMPSTWYSASQTFWAGLGILLTLLALQGWRRSGGAWRLVVAAICAAMAGWFWTIGHVAGPAGAAYLMADGSVRSRKAALVPILATVAAVLISVGLGSSRLQVQIRFQGKDNDKPINFVRGASHTIQSISETLVIGNLGVSGVTSPGQAAVLTMGIFGLWVWTFRNGGRPVPLECAGGVILFLGYFITWSFRGYYEFVNLRGVLPWYDTVPHLGAVLFASGWWSRVWNPSPRPTRLTVGGSMGVIAVVLGLVTVHQPRATELFLGEPPKMTEAEAKVLPISELQRYRAIFFCELLARWQRDHLYHLDRAQEIARKAGMGRALIRKTFGRLDTPNLSDDYDAIDLLDLPEIGTETSEVLCRSLLGPLVAVPPKPVFPLDALFDSMKSNSS